MKETQMAGLSGAWITIRPEDMGRRGKRLIEREQLGAMAPREAGAWALYSSLARRQYLYLASSGHNICRTFEHVMIPRCPCSSEF